MATLRKTLFGLMLLAAFGIAAVAWRFVVIGIEPAFGMLGAEVLEPRFLLVAHVIAAPLALAAGAVQLLPWLRRRAAPVHRWTGRVYALAVLAGGLAGLGMAVDALATRPVAGVGFGLLAIFWIFFTATGVAHARARDFLRHRRQMIRSFALAFAAVSLRVQVPLLTADGAAYLDVSHIVAWSCWVPNLALVLLFERFGAARTDAAPAV